MIFWGPRSPFVPLPFSRTLEFFVQLIDGQGTMRNTRTHTHCLGISRWSENNTHHYPHHPVAEANYTSPLRCKGMVMGLRNSSHFLENYLMKGEHRYEIASN